MNKKTCILSFLTAALPLMASAQKLTYYDITSYYLQNSEFDSRFDYSVGETGNVAQEIRDVDGWTKNISVDYTITGVYQIGTGKTFNGASIPATNSKGGTDGGVLALSTGWNQSMLLYQKVTLPAGNYAIVTSYYNCGDQTAGTSRVGWIPKTNGLPAFSSLTSFETGKWLTDTVKFTVTTPSEGNIQIGYRALSGKGSAYSAKLAFDYIHLLRDSPVGDTEVGMARDNLSQLLSSVSASYGEGNGNGAEALKTAMDNAQNLIDNSEASFQQLTDGYNALSSAYDIYLWANPTGDIPTVVTDSRFARGATMAFGRMTVNGIASTEISRQGFCYSETSDPTINDYTTTNFINNNGRIYWLQDLKPATRYYMRAFVVTQGRQVAYGDIIKFYTIPKGQVTYTIRSGETEPTARITAAVKSAVEYWNNLTEIKGFQTNVGYNSGTPTAECSYGGYMSVGSNTSYQKTGTIMHELLHGVGVIPWADTEWSRHNLRASVNSDGYGTGTWLGDRTTAVVRFWDNSTTSQLSGDYQHMWPYGINGAHEDTGTDALYIGNSLICQALGEDGLQHTSSSFAEPYYSFDQEDGVKYYIKNEDADHGLYNSYLVEKDNNTLEWQQLTAAEAQANDRAAWYVSFTPGNQYYQLRNVATGHFMSYVTTGNNGIRAVNRSSGVAADADNFHLLPSRQDISVGSGTLSQRGYWIIHPTGNWSPVALNATSNGGVNTATFSIANSSTTQRWLILAASQLDSFDNAAVGGIKSKAKDILSMLKKLMATPHTEDVAGTDEAANKAIASIENLIANASDAAAVSLLISDANNATLSFLENATPSDLSQPFDLTEWLENPDMASADGWSQSPTLNYNCGEFYETTFDFYQTVANLPAGSYQFAARAFQRPGQAAAAYSAYTAGTSSVSAFIYAGSDSKRINNICTELQNTKLGGSESTVGSTYYIPNNMQAASIYFGQSLYDNRIATSVAKDDSSLKVGLRSNNMGSYYWVIFSDFRLYYYGSTDKSTLLGIKDIASEPASASTDGIYTLDGRRLNVGNASSLQSGIYIIGGKKVAIK